MGGYAKVDNGFWLILWYKARGGCKVCVYYCRTYYKAVREGGGGAMEDMCYERRRAEAGVN